MSLKPSIPAPSAHLGTPLAKDAQHALNASALNAAAKGAEALGAMQLTSLAAFHELAGMPHGRDPAARTARQPQQQMNTPAPSQRGGTPSRGASRPRGSAEPQQASAAKAEQDEGGILGREAGNILKRIRNGDQSDLEQNLRDQYDPLERYRLLQEALKQLDDEARSDEDKTPPRRQIQRLLDDLDKRHGREIREGLEATGDMHALLQSLGDASVNTVRGWFGTPAQGKVHAPLTPIDLAVRLKDAFGAGQCSDALTRLGQIVAKPLSARNHRAAGEPPLMALSDTRAFTTVRSCHAKALELKRQLAEINVTVRNRQEPMELAVTLMIMAASGKDQVANLAGSIIDFGGLSTRQNSRAWGCLRRVLSDLPLSLWPQDAGVKAGVMASIDDRLREQDAMSPRKAVPEAEKREAELRAQSEQAEQAKQNAKPVTATRTRS
ncbi:hypothetical protein [Noviherbaspirillum aerium]|uniref:hypothetical protein n=1 Tax=Noviherbaspirillum aerium TaxID=2588497 RepID=UPI00124BDA3B|nr:hypothetical protein [Noviherbaspirillum aerium]